MHWIGIGIALALVGVTAAAARRYNVYPYLFFLRFQLLAVVVALAPLALLNGTAASRLGNLFTLTPAQVVTTTVLAAFATWSLVFSGQMAWEAARTEYGISFRKSEPERVEGTSRVPYRPIAALMRHGLMVGLIIALPLLTAVVWFSSTDGWSWLRETRAETRMSVSLPGMVVFGVSLGLALVLTVRPRFYRLRMASGWVTCAIAGMIGGAVLGVYYLWLPSPFVVNIGAVATGVVVAWSARKALEEWFRDWLPTVLRAVAYLLVALTVYSSVYLLLGPQQEFGPLDAVIPTIPALGYLLLLGILILWVFAVTARVLDRYRVPVVPIVILAALLLHQVFRADHLFTFADTELGSDLRLHPAEAYEAWARSHPEAEYALPVAVAASGGGVGASYWTARVLTELQREMDRFAASVVLISATSGGSAGAALYAQAFEEGEPPPDEELESIRSRAGTPTLAAVTWGLALPDFLRTISGGLLPGDTLRDRGWALEQGWRRAGVLEGDDLTIGSWRRDVRAGWRPATVFNAAIAQSGAKLLLSPLDLDPGTVPGCGRDPMGIRQLYPTSDLGVRTAVRLSASAPWVLPLARPAGEPRVCHVGDGGYVDNTGFWSVVEYLTRVGPEPLRSREGLVLVELRGYETPGDAGTPGRMWWWGTVGPVAALMNSNLTSQPARDGSEIDMLIDRWDAAGVTVHRVVFEQNVATPWFWGLTDDGQAEIEAAWCSEANQDALEELKSLWQEAHPALNDMAPAPTGCD